MGAFALSLLFLSAASNSAASETKPAQCSACEVELQSLQTQLEAAAQAAVQAQQQKIQEKIDEYNREREQEMMPPGRQIFPTLPTGRT